MRLSTQQLDLLRNQPHKTNLWLSIYRPNTLMAARVTGTYSPGDTQISYYAVSTTGTYASMYPDVTVMVGTAPNTDNVGRIRMKSATGTYAVMAENGITWESGQYLTFLDYINAEAIYPKIIPDPSNATNVIFYKDDDIPYSNQNTIYGTFPNAGPHRAGFLEAGTGTSFYYSATGTYNVVSSSLTYGWVFDGGTPNTSSALTPGNIQYTVPGHYKTRLRVTAANGAVDDTYRYVSVYNRPGDGTNVPTLKWELNELSGSRDEGGYTASFKVYENLGDIEPNALVVIFADTWYGGTKVNLGGNAENNSSIVFVGYILTDTIRFNYESSSVDFSVGSISDVMKTTEGFSVSCESKASASTWFELNEMTVPKAIYHYLRWHSTILKVTDFQYTGDDRLVQYFDADRGSLYDAIDSFMREGMLGGLVSDRQGKLWAEISPFGLANPISSIPYNFTVHKQDWIGSPVIQERRQTDLSFIELGGIAFYGVSSNTFSALISNAPTVTPLYHGKSDRKEGLILTDQQQLNQLSGNYLAHHNTQFPDITTSLAGFYNNLDIAPLERLQFVIDSNDSVRGKSIQHVPYIVNSMEWSYDSKRESFRPDITVLQIATGTAGQTINIPPIAPDHGYSYPGLSLPPLPQFPISSSGVGATVNTRVIMHDTGVGLIYTENFDSVSPSWITVNAGLTAAQYQGITYIGITPSGGIYVAKQAIDWSGGHGEPFLAYAPSIGSTFTIIENVASITAKHAGTLVYLAAVGINALNGQATYVIGSDSTTAKIYIGTSITFSAGANIAGHNASASAGKGSITFGNNEWLLTGWNTAGGLDVSYWRVNANASSVLATSSMSDSYMGWHIQASAHADALCFHIPRFDNTIKTSTGDRSVFSAAFGDVNYIDGQYHIACDPSGMALMADTGVGRRGRSSDGGATWTNGNLFPSSKWFFCYAGSGGSVFSSRWIAVNADVRYSPDFGNTWLDKRGNLLTAIAPTVTLNIVKAIN